jgi:2-methylcitrate dehydratase PrpD
MTVATQANECIPALTDALIERVRSLDYDELPAHVVAMAKHCVLDWVGVAIAGSREPLVAILLDEARAQGVNGEAAVLGLSQGVSTDWAALINGASSHALDFDDVVSAMRGHPSVPILSALFGAGEQQRANGRAVIEAFVAGFEIACRVGSLMGDDHYGRGFHATGTVGTFAAAAACARLADLDVRQWRHAFGLAGAQAAGLKCHFGTMTKPFHAGKAAANGAFAVRLAARGFTAHPQVLDAEQGFVEALTDTPDPDAARSAEGSFGITDVLFKYHAACYLTHATIEAAKQLRADPSLDIARIESIRVVVPRGHLKVCNIAEPETGLQGKFSLRFTTALALLRDETGEAMFNDDTVAEPDLVALRDRVTVEASDTLANNYVSDVHITLDNGETIGAIGDVSRSASEDRMPEQWQRLTDKFNALVAPVLGPERAEQLIDAIGSLETLADLTELGALAAGRKIV